MTPERLQQIIASYGADPERWPDSERASARSLADCDPGLHSALETAQELDLALHTDTLPDLDAFTAQRIAHAVLAKIDAAAPRTTTSAAAATSLTATAPSLTATAASSIASPPTNAGDVWRTNLIRPALAAAATLLLGFSLGFSGLLTSANSSDDETLAIEVAMAPFTTNSTAKAWLETSGAAAGSGDEARGSRQ